jgi:hypothetical protein
MIACLGNLGGKSRSKNSISKETTGFSIATQVIGGSVVIDGP